MSNDGHTDVDKWDRDLTKHVVALTRPIVKHYFRSEVRGLDNIPSGACLVVSNHPGGPVSIDLSAFTVGFYDRYGYDRPLYALGFDTLFAGLATEFFNRIGVIRATRDNAAEALAAGAVVLVFLGGDFDVYRPSAQENASNFGGGTGYVTTAIEANVPIVPAVSIGGQEERIFLTSGRRISRALRLTNLFRTNILSVTVGFPFAFSMVAPVNVLPTKIVTEVLPQIDVAAEFGQAPDVNAVDAHVRQMMQEGLDNLAV
jgi:1-acyl-sn-glycerol-3-phosphate acyltransferase